MEKRSFTLLEVLVYIGILSIVLGVVLSFLVWSVHSSTKINVMRETSDNARRAMEIMVYEIREAMTIYTPTSTSTQLSLQTLHYLPAGEDTTYIDFYICGTQLCLKKESQKPIALTSDKVEVSNLVLTPIVTEEIPSVQIELKIDYKNPSNRPEYQASVDLKSTASLRSY
jgi:type II secretory pathway pseudopilin PulG